MLDKPSHALADVARSVGNAGTTAMASIPGLLAAVDQHAAAVRDLLAASGKTLDVASLGEYLVEFTESALERGWTPGDDRDWEFVRIVAVCWLMTRHDY